MSKSKKKKKSHPSDVVKPAAEQTADPVAEQATNGDNHAKDRLMVRAIRVTPELLEAAKAYKKASGKSFYALGFEAISDRLVREGFLKESTEPKS